MPSYSQTSDNNLHAQAAVRRHSLTPTPFGGLHEEAFRRFPAFEIQAIQTEGRQTRLYACRWRIRLLLSTAKRVPRFFCHPFRPLKTAPELSVRLPKPFNQDVFRVVAFWHVTERKAYHFFYLSEIFFRFLPD